MIHSMRMLRSLAFSTVMLASGFANIAIDGVSVTQAVGDWYVLVMDPRCRSFPKVLRAFSTPQLHRLHVDPDPAGLLQPLVRARLPLATLPFLFEMTPLILTLNT
jgi:hypothetical protein